MFLNYLVDDSVAAKLFEPHKFRLCFHRSQSSELFMGGDDTQLSGS